MFKIGEFSKMTQVSIRMLRYYDEQGVLTPCMVDAVNGYRLYSASQIEKLNRILLLRDMGFQIKDIKAALASWNTKSIRTQLLEQREKTRQAIMTEQERLNQIDGYLKSLEIQTKHLSIQIRKKQIPSYTVISLRRVVADYYCEGTLWKELSAVMEEKGKCNTKFSFSIYHDLDYREQEVDIEVCVVVEDEKLAENLNISYRQVPAVPMAACFMVYGPYSNISIAYKEFAYWLEQHPEYVMAGENRQICHISACQTDNPEEYITELQIPLQNTKRFLTLT